MLLHTRATSKIVCLLERGLPVGAATRLLGNGITDLARKRGELLFQQSALAEGDDRHTHPLGFRQSRILRRQQLIGERYGRIPRIGVAVVTIHTVGLVHDQHNVSRSGSGDRGGGAITGCGQMQRVLIAFAAIGFHDAFVVRWFHIGIHDGHVARLSHGERAGFGVCIIVATLLRHWGTVRGHGVVAGIQLPHRILGVISEIVGLHTGKLTPGQLYHTVVFGRRIGVNDLIGVRIVHAVFALVRIFGTVDEQLELELFVRVDGAQGFLLDIDGLGRLHRQIETDLAVGSAVAAFQIEEAQMMCRIRLGIPLLSAFLNASVIVAAGVSP